MGCVLLDMITCDTLTVRHQIEYTRLNIFIKKDEETLQLRICARHDASTLAETLQSLQSVS